VKQHLLFYSESVTIAFKDVAFSIDVTDPHTKEKTKKVILEPCSGLLQPGKLVAVMGPSGCGKSTLVDILAGKKKPGTYAGEVFLNGHLRDELYSQVTAYVPQDDIMPPLWLVKEAIMFNFMLRRPRPKRKMPFKMQKIVADEVLASIGLSHVANSCIGDATVRGISGGQRRRVTLARGLVSGANAMFCDEPTSGLSSTDAETCIARLKAWAYRFGMSITVVIHQPKPEVASLFDHLILLTSQPGRLVYSGPVRDATEHYAKVGYPVPQFVNPADFYLDMVSPGYRGEQSQLFAEYYLKHEAPRVAAEVEAATATLGLTAREVIDTRYIKQAAIYGPLDKPAGGVYVVPYTRQLKIVFHRQLALVLRDRKKLVVELVLSVVKGLILGIGFYDIGSKAPSQQVAFIFTIINLAVTSLFSSISPLISDRLVMKFDVSDTLYPVSCFIISSFSIQLVRGMLANFIFVLTAFAMGGIDFSSFGDFYFWFLLCMLTMESFVSMIAAAAKDMGDAIMKAMPLFIMFSLFNGFFITKATVLDWMEWAIYASPFFHAISQISVALYSDGTPSTDPSYQDSGQYVIDLYQFEKHTGQSVAVLVVELVVFRVLQVFFLSKLNNIEK